MLLYCKEKFPYNYFSLPKVFKRITPIMMRIIPIIPYVLGVSLYFNTPNKVTAVIVNAPYVAYVNPTGIIVMALERQKIQIIILVRQKNEG